MLGVSSSSQIFTIYLSKIHLSHVFASISLRPFTNSYVSRFLYQIRICSKVHFDVLSIYLRKDASANYFLNVACLFVRSESRRRDVVKVARKTCEVDGVFVKTSQ